MNIQHIHSTLSEIFKSDQLIEARFGKPHPVNLRPIFLKKKLSYQVTTQHENKAHHQNFSSENMLSYILDVLLPNSSQSTFYTNDFDLIILKNKKGLYKMIRKPSSKDVVSHEHNQPKNTILSPHAPCPFLTALGILKENGLLFPKKGNKFRQINRFLEVVKDVLPQIENLKKIQIVDFGCGKGYLTFALYHYLHEIKKLPVNLLGLDLKEDVIEDCNILARKLGYENLSFRVGDIQDFQPEEQIHMMVALHACNTATDFALAKAVEWRTWVILSAPCCQHELYNQIKNNDLEMLLQHGIIREKMASLATDAARADILQLMGYTTQILEFVDPEHTPKNLLIRATIGNTADKRNQAWKRYQACKAALHIQPMLEGLLVERKLWQLQDLLLCE